MRRIPGLLAALAIALPGSSAAHEIPSDVTVQAFLKPEGRKLRLLVRVPLLALPDVDFPSRWPGMLDLSKADLVLRDAAYQWIADSLQLYEGDERLGEPGFGALRVSLPSERYVTYGGALALVTGPALPRDTVLPWSQGMLDVLFEYEVRSEAGQFSIRPGLERLAQRVVIALRFLPPGGAVRAFELSGDPGLVRLDPRWHQAAFRFVGLGFRHILDGIDHLLFLLCLVIPLRRFGALVLVVTSFTLAHSITLIASAFDVAPNALWFPPLIELLIAASIVYMALENVVAPQLQRRWMITFGFGLVHGFGFSFALKETLQFAGSHLLASLVSFNVGVELGQLLVLVAMVPLLELAFKRVFSERVGTILLSALVAHTGWHWMLERFFKLRQYRFEWPALDTLLLVGVLRWLMLGVIAGGLAWLVFGVLLRAMERGREGQVRGLLVALALLFAGTAEAQMQEYAVPAGARPHDVAPALDGGVWYTAQRSGELGFLLPASGASTLIPLGAGSAPHGVIVGPDGAAWITDGGLNAIVRYDPLARRTTEFPVPWRNANLNTAVFDKEGVLWFTGQAGMYGRLDPAEGVVRAWGAPRGAGPYGITVTPGGDVYYASLAGNHIARIDRASGQATPLDPPTARQGARRVWSDSLGRIWVSEWNAGQLGLYDPATGQWREWRCPGPRPQAYAVYVDEKDKVWVSEWGQNALLRFDPTTETFESFPHPAAGADVRQILGRPGEVWGAMSGQDKLVVVRTTP